MREHSSSATTGHHAHSRQAVAGDIAALLSRGQVQDFSYRTFENRREREIGPPILSEEAQQQSADDAVVPPSKSLEAASHGVVAELQRDLASGSEELIHSSPVSGYPASALPRQNTANNCATQLQTSANCIGILSLVGGSGKSTLAANLASLFCRFGENVLLLGTSDFSSLPFQFGARESRPGERTFIAPNSKQSKLRLVLPEFLTASWFQSVVPPAANTFHRTILDIGSMPKDLLRLALSKCSIVLVPLLPDLNSVRSISMVQALFTTECEDAPAKALFYILNQHEGAALSGTIANHLREHLGESLLSFTIARSSEHNEAARAGLTLVDYAPQSSSARTYGQIAEWLRALSPLQSNSGATPRWIEV